MKQILFLVPPKDFQDPEYREMANVLTEENIETVVASTDWRCEGSLGMSLTPELLVRSVTPRDFEALVVIGGVGAKELAADVSAIEMIREFTNERKLLSAVGRGIKVLAAANILEDRWVAVPAIDTEAVRAKGGKPTTKALVVDGRIITADSHSAAELAALLSRLIGSS